MKTGEKIKTGTAQIQYGHKPGEDHSVALLGTTGHYRNGADRLENHIYNTCCDVAVGGVVRHVAEVGGGDIQRQRTVSLLGDITYVQVDLLQLARNIRDVATRNGSPADQIQYFVDEGTRWTYQVFD